MLDRMLLAAEAGEKIFVEDVFSTYIYTGGADQFIINNINLADKGGLVWIKARNTTDPHSLFDTDRGVNRKLVSNSTAASTLVSNSLTNFINGGFRVGGGDGAVNSFGGFYGSWTFRKSPKFFDIVTYTGNGTSQNIAHNLGSVPGMIIVKRTDSIAASSWWAVYHRSLANPNNNFLRLDSTNAQADYGGAFISGVSSTSFTVSDSGAINISGGTYVAYIFAHDTTSDGIIQCGSYTGNGSSEGPVINLGWEPQWVLIKQTNTSTYSWMLMDNMRGMRVAGTDAFFTPNFSDPEYSVQLIDPTATGFSPNTTLADVNASGSTYIYMAIRRGPMRAPTLGTDVFKPDASTSTGGTFVSTGFPVDAQLTGRRFGADHLFVDKLRFASSNTTQGGRYLQTSTTNAETTGDTSRYWRNVGYDYPQNLASQSNVIYSFRRAPSFFDVVCYTGTGVYDTPVRHNLGVPPELIIVKSRSLSGTDWPVRCSALTFPQFQITFLNKADALIFSGSYFVGTPTATTFNVDGSGGFPVLNQSGQTYVAYLFASCAGVSKVGSYTGNGSSQTINCAFSAGARFVMIKRTDGAGDWYVWDTARGIISGNDPHLSLNTAAEEVTSDDTIDPNSTGFIVNQVSATNVNVNTATYIYLAIA